MNNFFNILRSFLILTLVTGVIYPLTITGIAQLTMREKAEGEFVFSHEKKVGALLIAQKFEEDRYYWGRPSAIEYNPLSSGGSNLGPTSNALKKIVHDRREKILKSHSNTPEEIPSELLFASASGLDPHISVSTAYYQMERVAKTRKRDINDMKELIDKMVIRRPLGFLGRPLINVLLLNTALDANEEIK